MTVNATVRTSPGRGPHIASLGGVTVGETPTARLTLSVLKSLTEQRGSSVQEALTVVASRCLCDEWTVYRWLRGQREPANPKTLDALTDFAADLGRWHPLPAL